MFFVYFIFITLVFFPIKLMAHSREFGDPSVFGKKRKKYFK